MRKPLEYSSSNMARLHNCAGASASFTGLDCDTRRTASSAASAFGKGLDFFGALTPSTGLEGRVICSDNQSKKPRHTDSLREIERALRPRACNWAANLRTLVWLTACSGTAVALAS